MGKYKPLSTHLAAHPADEWRTSFSELESVLGFPLPRAARAGRAWWAAEPARGHSRAWALQGWAVDDVDHAAERVVFRKTAASPIALVEAAGLKPLQEPAPAPAGAVQPAAMRKAAELASRSGAAWETKVILAVGLVVAAGLGAVLVRGAMRRRV